LNGANIRVIRGETGRTCLGKLKQKLGWRVRLLKLIINQGLFKFIDLLYLPIPRGVLLIKKEREALERISGERLLFNKCGDKNLCEIRLKGLKILLPRNLKREAVSWVLGFGLPLLPELKKSELSTLHYFDEGPYEMGYCSLDEGYTVIDAGANIGIFTLFASRVIGGKGKIYAFEPVEKIRAVLEANIKNNNIRNCEAVGYALGDENKNTRIFINENNLTVASLTKKKSTRKEENVFQIKLDDFIKKMGVDKVDFIKSDIEGSEKDMLEGGKEAIKKFKPKIAICTYHMEGDADFIEKFLKTLVPEYKILRGYKKIYAYCQC
jgi:FkbM family methyltransferase